MAVISVIVILVNGYFVVEVLAIFLGGLGCFLMGQDSVRRK